MTRLPRTTSRADVAAATTHCVPPLVRWMTRRPVRSMPTIRDGEFPTSKPSMGRPPTSPVRKSAGSSAFMASASAGSLTSTISRAPAPMQNAAVVNARKTSITTAVPVAVRAPSSRLARRTLIVIRVDTAAHAHRPVRRRDLQRRHLPPRRRRDVRRRAEGPLGEGEARGRAEPRRDGYELPPHPRRRRARRPRRDRRRAEAERQAEAQLRDRHAAGPARRAGAPWRDAGPGHPRHQHAPALRSRRRQHASRRRARRRDVPARLVRHPASRVARRDALERTDASVVSDRRLRPARGRGPHRADRRRQRAPSRAVGRAHPGAHPRDPDRAHLRWRRDAVLLRGLHAGPSPSAAPLDTRSGPLPAGHARGEANDPAARGRGTLDRRVHARRPAVRPDRAAGWPVPVRGASGDMSDAMPRTASTVVVGGGIVGAATAFFLADRGERDVVLLERDTLGSGTTKGGLGGIRHQFTDELDVRLSLMATQFWREFSSFTGSAHEFEERGYLFLAETAAGLAQLKEPLPLYERLGVPVEMLDRQDIEDLVPGIRTDDLAGGRVCVRDGYGDPLAAVAGFAAGAVLEGVRLFEGTAVTELVRDGDRVTGVRTAKGDIEVQRVLLATGCWTAPLAATAGIAVPIWPYRRIGRASCRERV